MCASVCVCGGGGGGGGGGVKVKPRCPNGNLYRKTDEVGIIHACFI